MGQFSHYLSLVCEKTNCVSVYLFWSELPDSVNSFKCFAICFPGVQRYKILSVGNDDNFASSLLISFSWWTALFWVFRKIVNCDNLRYPYLISHFDGNTSITYTLNIILALDLQYVLFLCFLIPFSPSPISPSLVLLGFFVLFCFL